MVNSRTLIACPKCGANKDRKTHTYGAYKVYICGSVITLRCKTCRHEQKFRTIRGGYVRGLPDDKETIEEDSDED